MDGWMVNEWLDDWVGEWEWILFQWMEAWLDIRMGGLVDGSSRVNVGGWWVMGWMVVKGWLDVWMDM